MTKQLLEHRSLQSKCVASTLAFILHYAVLFQAALLKFSYSTKHKRTSPCPKDYTILSLLPLIALNLPILSFHVMSFQTCSQQLEAIRSSLTSINPWDTWLQCKKVNRSSLYFALRRSPQSWHDLCQQRRKMLSPLEPAIDEKVESSVLPITDSNCYVMKLMFCRIYNLILMEALF